MTPALIRAIRPLSMPMPTQSPFLFAVFHNDTYPEGKPDMSINAPLHNRNIGSDFGNKDWNMYHGTTVPGFPQHPHRGFETITVSHEGLVDHHDSMGCQGRFGNGDTQWMTAGAGISHSEMFPLLNDKGPNPLDFFQIWINLPKKNKMVTPYFTMHWKEDTPVQTTDTGATVRLVAGQLPSFPTPCAPPPDSWASDPANEVAVITIDLPPGASWTLPQASAGVNRSVFYVKGPENGSVAVASTPLPSRCVVEVDPEQEVALTAATTSTGVARFLVLQGKPIPEPVAQHGPFVMNTRDEIMQAFMDYRSGKFGKWPWADDDPVIAKHEGRFAKYADGRVERPGGGTA